jgi:hypothetical protein
VEKSTTIPATALGYSRDRTRIWCEKDSIRTVDHSKRPFRVLAGVVGGGGGRLYLLAKARGDCKGDEPPESLQGWQDLRRDSQVIVKTASVCFMYC